MAEFSFDFIFQAPLAETWTDAITALKNALKLEAHVTRKLVDIAKICEDPGQDGEHWNDYHVIRIFFTYLVRCNCYTLSALDIRSAPLYLLYRVVVEVICAIFGPLRVCVVRLLCANREYAFDS